MTYHFQNPDQKTITDYITSSKTIAVVGLSNRTESAAYNVAKVMQDAGYTIIPINPNLVGETLLGETVYARLQDVEQPIDIVDVFRRSTFLPDVAKDFVEAKAGIFWAQLGLESQEAEAILRENGVHSIVMNKCLKLEYQALKREA